MSVHKQISYLWLWRWGRENCGLRFDSGPRSSTDRSLWVQPQKWWRWGQTWCPMLQTERRMYSVYRESQKDANQTARPEGRGATLAANIRDKLQSPEFTVWKCYPWVEPHCYDANIVQSHRSEPSGAMWNCPRRGSPDCCTSRSKVDRRPPHWRGEPTRRCS